MVFTRWSYGWFLIAWTGVNHNGNCFKFFGFGFIVEIDPLIIGTDDFNCYWEINWRYEFCIVTKFYG